MVLKAYYSVSEITRYIKGMLDTDILLSNVSIQGEISNLKLHYSGHAYFTLKDEQSVIKAVMFKSKNIQLNFKLENGMKVIVRGYVSVYEATGQYQIYVDNVKQLGTGDLYIAFEKLKEKLSAEGLFEQNRKKKLPVLPETIAVVTSATGSVIRDIINILSRRFPNFHLILYPVKVQGKGAAEEIAAAISQINKLKLSDVIIVARGGGSLEELWPFNEEITVRSIAASCIPVISAVGHETDFTISDFVADVRAPTPSAAAEIVMPDKEAVKKIISEQKDRIIQAMMNNLNHKKEVISRLSENQLKMPLIYRLNNNILKCDHLTSILVHNMTVKLQDYKNKINGLTVKLDAMGPLNTLNRGFSLVLNDRDNNILKSVNEVLTGDTLNVLLADGTIKAVVQSKNEGRPENLFEEVLKNE